MTHHVAPAHPIERVLLFDGPVEIVPGVEHGEARGLRVVQEVTRPGQGVVRRRGAHLHPQADVALTLLPTAAAAQERRAANRKVDSAVEFGTSNGGCPSRAIELGLGNGRCPLRAIERYSGNEDVHLGRYSLVR